MRNKQAVPSSPQFTSVLQRFETWRETRSKRTPIPEALWQSAVSLAQDHSLYTISSALHLNYSALKQRVDALSAASIPSVKADRPVFVELDCPTSTFSATGVFEMEKPNGTKLKLHLQGLDLKDLLALSHSFWSEGL